MSYWLEVGDTQTAPLRVDVPAGANLEQQAESVTAALDTTDTEALLHAVPAAYRTQINDLLLTALAQTLGEWTQTESILIDLEGHEREALFDGVDLSRTVGWFTSLFPVAITLPKTASSGDAIKAVKEQLWAIPNKGIGYGLLRYLSTPEIAERLAAQPTPQVGFNYLGQFDQVVSEGGLFVIAE